MRGVILAGGSGTRLKPMTDLISKQALPVYNKPMIYYPLSVLMNSGIREILIISAPRDLLFFKKLLGSGEKWGMSFSYIEQPFPGGLAQAYILGAEFVGDSPSVLILGDNIFYGAEIPTFFQKAREQKKGATIVACHTQDPNRYGIVEVDSCNRAISIEEKPITPKSSFAVTGLYFYDKEVVNIVRSLQPSARGELEITDVNCHYLKEGLLSVDFLSESSAWFDAGTPESLFDTSLFVRNIENRLGFGFAYPEEIAYRRNFISLDQFVRLIDNFGNSFYGLYLKNVIEHKKYN
ncbi:glucose-1-phosphate thymidylyltransferase RfbA [Candidatus Liberibacter solanacearum]|uniref:Glucose-1-phosphate thymidylyltransferase n=1 Tax=Candidatus Liberibacter solanacearum TaxID=556287 RepID=A0A1V2N717_9HYPH|nr:glucose-1-phosphate thymidylyltransferase RfbA [Candidatus Liberibacter solanacearum]ONI58609.1 glucose-1-phosphate thymidylyltransferase [Candidatus Liberibacter solanacearum]ONI59528.1 glucose-1-phosphate thymidylyltransferase [Candidatus Liberibacter solanacearum]